MKIESILKEKLTSSFSPYFFALENESHKHSVPANSETHFKMLIVSDSFAGMSRIQRQRTVNEVISEELAGPVHAFAQRVYTVEEWKNLGEKTEFISPDCLGGSKYDPKI